MLKQWCCWGWNVFCVLCLHVLALPRNEQESGLHLLTNFLEAHNNKVAEAMPILCELKAHVRA